MLNCKLCLLLFLSLVMLIMFNFFSSVLIFGIGTIITKSLSCFSGLIMYSKYSDCDPITSGAVKRMDQLLPFYVLDVAKSLPGLSGIFVSGIFSTALSTMSTALNTSAGTIYEDFIKHRQKTVATEKTGSKVMKIIVVVMGCICVGLVFLVEKMGGVLQVSMSFSGITGGPLLGLFTLGMLFPSANAKGALYGSISSFVFVGWMCAGQLMHIFNGNIVYETKSVSVDGCNGMESIASHSLTNYLNFTSTNFPSTNFTSTNLTSTNFTSTSFTSTNFTSQNNAYQATTEQNILNREEPLWLFKISFYWYCLIGMVITLVVGLIVSYFTKEKNNKPIDKDLLSPVIYWMLPKTMEFNNEHKYSEKNYNYTPVELKVIESKLES